jgi:uncharacterized NAD(P)/FAD-binding protein YdhS
MEGITGHVAGPESHNCRIAIAGGGCSGALAAAQLFRHGFTGSAIIIDTRPNLGHGLAYSTSFEQHLLNVPAGKMSAFPDQPSHFLDWLTARHWPGAHPEAFAPRSLYGEYIEETLAQCVRGRTGGALHHVRGEVVDLEIVEDEIALTLSDGSSVHAPHAILALGNPASGPFDGSSAQPPAAHWHNSPWHGNALEVRSAGERILLVGTGLTAVDAALALHAQKLPCKTYMISRRGILPKVHDLRRAPAAPPEFQDEQNIRLMFRQLRSQIRELRERDGCWRTAVDSLRPVSNSLWSALSLEDRARFQRHLRTYWETHRHRMAPQVYARIEQLRREGAIEIAAGRIRQTAQRGEAIVADLEERGGRRRELEVDRAINCSGIVENYRKAPRRLIGRLIAKGFASPNDLGTGFHTDDLGALIDSEGNVSSSLFTLGPPRRGGLFETTAVPEIRAQAEALARHLVR